MGQTVVATITDVDTPANTLILTSVASSQNITITNSGTGDLVVDGDVFSAALRSAILAPSGSEAKLSTVSTVTKESGTDASISITSDSASTAFVLVTFTTSTTTRKVNADELSRAISNVLNDE